MIVELTNAILHRDAIILSTDIITTSILYRYGVNLRDGIVMERKLYHIVDADSYDPLTVQVVEDDIGYDIEDTLWTFANTFEHEGILRRIYQQNIDYIMKYGFYTLRVMHFDIDYEPLVKVILENGDRRLTLDDFGVIYNRCHNNSLLRYLTNTNPNVRCSPGHRPTDSYVLNKHYAKLLKQNLNEVKEIVKTCTVDVADARYLKVRVTPYITDKSEDTELYKYNQMLKKYGISLEYVQIR